jgi:hypothetical protein
MTPRGLREFLEDILDVFWRKTEEFDDLEIVPPSLF